MGYIAEIVGVHASKKDIGVSVESNEDLRANVDREQLQRALLNLLLNAIDATPVGGHVAVRCSRPSSQSVELQVENSGDPIPKEVLSRIFEPSTPPNRTEQVLDLRFRETLREFKAEI